MQISNLNMKQLNFFKVLVTKFHRMRSQILEKKLERIYKNVTDLVLKWTTNAIESQRRLQIYKLIEVKTRGGEGAVVGKSSKERKRVSNKKSNKIFLNKQV